MNLIFQQSIKDDLIMSILGNRTKPKPFFCPHKSFNTQTSNRFLLTTHLKILS